MRLVLNSFLVGVLWSFPDVALSFQQPITKKNLQLHKSQGVVPSNLFRSPLLKRSASTIDISDEVAGTLEEQPQTKDEEGSFDWFKTWHPLVPVEILDVDVPHHFQLLGMDIVIWNDAKRNTGKFESKKTKLKKNEQVEFEEGTWRAFVDECPHRKVPLSEGRVENDGTLFCSYHGWRFDGDGSCVDIPQVSEEKLETIAANPKSSCNSFPTQVINGLLFVWPSNDKDAALESALTPVVHVPEEKDGAWFGPWNYRELPYGHDYFQENVVDPAHVMVSHHNIIGNRYTDMEGEYIKSEPLSKKGFSIKSKPKNPDNPDGYTEFHAPGLVKTGFDTGAGAQRLELYSSPSRPGFSNHAGRMVILKDDPKGPMPPAFRQFTLPLPKWANHIMASAFLNQDALFLHHQERYLHHSNQYSTVGPQEDDGNSYVDAILPANSDLGVLNYRKWMSKFAGGGIPYRNYRTMPESSTDVVFDVWNGHTKHCKYCLDALRRLKKARAVSVFVAACVGVLRPFGKVPSLLATLGLGGTGWLLHKLIGMFYRYEFSHAEND
mmetsp:Transcript_19169/g.47385  ORF Transcript_19169/g.47385 Transcript_19169/m.47385 type:complete len:550 (+) Transcript_19169:131-1780(+)